MAKTCLFGMTMAIAAVDYSAAADDSSSLLQLHRSSIVRHGTEDQPVSLLPPRGAATTMRMFEDAYNANVMEKAASVYHQSCHVTVNGGVEEGGPFTGHNPEEVAGFLDALRNNMGGTHIRFAVTKVDGSVHEDVWVADNGAGACKATWQQIDGKWMIVQDEISFTPMVNVSKPNQAGVPPEFVVNQMRKFEDAYNADDMEKASSLYAPECLVTVNGGGTFTGHTPKDVAGFLGALRNNLGGTHIKFAVTKVDGSVHEDVWVADNGAGACKATWQQIDGEWLIVKDEISFTPMVTQEEFQSCLAKTKETCRQQKYCKSHRGRKKRRACKTLCGKQSKAFCR